MNKQRIGGSEVVLGRKIYLLRDGFYEDDFGTLYDYRNGKLYEQRRPGVWF